MSMSLGLASGGMISLYRPLILEESNLDGPRWSMMSCELNYSKMVRELDYCKIVHALNYCNVVREQIGRASCRER